MASSRIVSLPECDSVTSLQVRFGCDHHLEAEAAEIQSSPVAVHAGSSLARASLEGNGRFLNL